MRSSGCGRDDGGALTLARAAAAALAAGPAALVTVLATEGSAPRGPGARMLVTAGALAGTIGGGALEWRAAEQARAMLALPAGAWRVQDWPLGPLLGQCCGGRVRVLVERLGDAAWLEGVERGERVDGELGDGIVHRRFLRQGGGPASARGADRAAAREMANGLGPLLRGGTERTSARGPLPSAGFAYVEPLDTPQRPLLLFGAGHVGRAIAALTPALPLALAWYDSRPEADAPGVVVDGEEALVACARDARGEAAVLILTHDHALDYRLTAAALASPASFVGLIGSATKRARFVSRLAADRIDPARLTCPIGSPGIVGKEPAVIAIAAVAQLLALRDKAA